MPEQHITRLFNLFFQGKISAEEKVALARWIQESGEEEHLKDLMEKSWQQFEPGDSLSPNKADELLERIKLEAKMNGKIVKMKRRTWSRIAVAASIILAMVIGSYFLFFNKGKQTEIAKVNDNLPHDVQPPTATKAMITMTGGKVISIDSLTSFSQGNVKVMKTEDGKIVYSGDATKVEFNTLTNPKGSPVIDMELADGSHVWLNAGSSVTYPIAFVGNERKVNITGEAYFEVAHDATKPFIVSKGETNVTVLGTHFNDNAYDDESDIKITLLEGSVKINNDKILKPGEQAQVGTAIKVISGVDIDEVMAWKNGWFDFRSMEIKDIMRQIEKWYDVDVSYEGRVSNEHFSGIVSRNSNVSQVLKIIEQAGVKFKIEGNKITVIQ